MIETIELRTYGLGNTLYMKKIKPIKNIKEFIKPYGGLWSSPTTSKYGWEDWCLQEDFGDLTSYFDFKVNGNCCVIDKYSDIEKLTWVKSAYGLYAPDFERAIMKYDMIWLTINGEKETRYTTPLNLYGWDCESILILNKRCII